MSRAYEPIFPERAVDDDLDDVRERFEAAARPYLSSPATWVAWGLVLPAAALAQPAVEAARGLPGSVILWSVAILVGGAVEAVGFLSRRGARSGGVAAWALRTQGNLSLVAVLLSGALLAAGRPALLPGLWLLLLGHSLFGLGGLASAPLRRVGLAYQAGGLVALLPFSDPLLILAATTGLANLAMAGSVWRRGRHSATSPTR